MHILTSTHLLLQKCKPFQSLFLSTNPILLFMLFLIQLEGIVLRYSINPIMVIFNRRLTILKQILVNIRRTAGWSANLSYETLKLFKCDWDISII